MKRLIFVILAVVVGCTLADVSAGTITLGMSLTTTPVGSTRAEQGSHILNGLNLWLDAINSTSASIRGQTYRFELKILEDDGSIDKITSNYVQLMNDSSVDFLFGPVGSEASNPISALTNSSQRMLIGTSVGSVDFYTNMGYSFSVVPASTRCPSVSFPYFRLKGSTKVALMISQARNPKEACSGINDEMTGAAANGLEIVASYQINSSLGNVSEYAQTQITDMVLDLKTKEVDVVIGCAFGDTGALIMDQFREHNFAPNFVTFLPFDTQYSDMDNSLSDFITGCSRFEAGANFVKDPIFGGTQKFVQAYQSKYGGTPDDYSAFGAMAGMLYQISIQSAASFSQDDVRDSVERFNQDTFMGQVFFGVDHSNQMSCLYVQMVNGSRVVVGPPLAQLTSFNVIDPFPGWEERSFVRTFNDYEAEWVFFSLALLGIAFSLGLLIYVVVARDTPIIKASSPNLLIIFLIGSMFLYASIFTWTLSNVTAASCYIQSWILSFGWTIMFGALIAKSWRVYKLSSNNSLQIFKITDAQLVFIILGLLAGNIIVCAVQAGVVDMTPVRVHVDEYRPIYDYEQCPEDGAVIGIAASLIAYNGVLCVAGLIIAWKIRKLRYSVYNESKIIAFSMYNAAFFATLVIVLQFTQATERDLLYILRSAGIMLGTAVSVATLFVTKLTMNREKHSNSFKSAGFTSSTYGSSNNNLSSYASTDALRIADLQKKLEAKEDEVVQLRKKKSAANGGDAEYYQNKYELLYSENQALKNEMFKLKDLLEKNKRQSEPPTPSSYQPNSTSSTSISDNNVQN